MCAKEVPLLFQIIPDNFYITIFIFNSLHKIVLVQYNNFIFQTNIDLGKYAKEVPLNSSKSFPLTEVLSKPKKGDALRLQVTLTLTCVCVNDPYVFSTPPPPQIIPYLFYYYYILYFLFIIFIKTHSSTVFSTFV